MDPVSIGMLVMGGLSMMHNLDKEKRDRQLAAATQRYSPWTGVRAQPVEDANPYGDMAQAGAGAMAYEQNKEASDLRKQLTAAQIRALDRGGPYALTRNVESPIAPIPYAAQDYWQKQYKGY